MLSYFDKDIHEHGFQYWLVECIDDCYSCFENEQSVAELTDDSASFPR